MTAGLGPFVVGAVAPPDCIANCPNPQVQLYWEKNEMTNQTKRHKYLFLAAGLALVALMVLVTAVSAVDGPDPLPSRAPQAGGGLSASGGDFLVSTVSENHLAPVVAYNATDDEYLVVWMFDTTGDDDLYGQIYSAQGVATGENFVIATSDYDKASPAVAHNSTANEYLVVWTDFRHYDSTTGNTDIHGQRLDADGNLLNNPGTPEDETDPGVDFPISSAEAGQRYPAVAYNVADDEYLVVWEDVRFNLPVRGDDVYGQRVDADGSLLGTDPTVNFCIACYDYDQSLPQVAYNVADDEYLVVWEYWSAGQSDVYGRVVAGDGSLPGSQISISAILEDQRLPAVAWSSARDEYFVVWNDYRDRNDTGSDIYGQRLDAAGALADGEITISQAPGDQTRPHLAYNPAAEPYDQVLVVWYDGRDTVTSGLDIYGRRILADGSVGGQEFAICQAVHDQYNPVVVYSEASHQFLVTWYTVDWDAAESYVSAQRVWWPGLLLGHSFDVAAPQMSQDFPAVAYNSRNHQYLVVWADERGGEANIYGQRYNRFGLPVGDNFVVHEGAGAQTHPVVVHSAFGNRYLVVWEDVASGDIQARFVSAQGTPYGSLITVSSGPEARIRPAVVQNPSAIHNDFMVVFTVQRTADSDIYGRRIAAAGTPSNQDIVVSDAAGHQGSPDIAYNPDQNQYLVVWRDRRDDQGDIYGQKLSATGALQAGELLVKQEADEQGAPAVAWNDDDEQYLVVWHDYRDSGITGADVYAQRLYADGSTYGSERTITDEAGNQQSPDVVYVNALNRYRIIWQDDRNGDTGWDIYGQWMSAGGAVLGVVDLPIFRYAGWQQYPATAYSPDDNRALTVWQDGRNGVDTDVYGCLGALDLTPPTAHFNVGPSWGTAGGVFVFNAGSSTDDMTPRGALTVRWDWNDDGAWDTPLSFDKYVTRTINVPGTYTVTLGVWDLGWNVDIVSHSIEALPAILVNAPQASAPTATVTVAPAFGHAGETFSFDGTGSTGTGSLTARWDWGNDGEFDTGFATGLTATHVYTVTGDHTVRIEVRDDSSGLTDAALESVTVRPGDVDDLEVLPGELMMLPEETERLWAIGWDVYDNWMLHPDVAWTTTDPEAGKISATGLLTSGLKAGAYPDVIWATSGNVVATASVTIFWPSQVYLPLVGLGLD